MLKFRAKPGMSTPWPNSHVGGQVRRFIGRQYDAEKRAYPASDEPTQVDEKDEDAVHIIRRCSRGELWAADESTARACDVAFVDLARDEDGEWIAAAAKPKTIKVVTPKE